MSLPNRDDVLEEAERRSPEDLPANLAEQLTAADELFRLNIDESVRRNPGAPRQDILADALANAFRRLTSSALQAASGEKLNVAQLCSEASQAVGGFSGTLISKFSSAVREEMALRAINSLCLGAEVCILVTNLPGAAPAETAH